MRKTGASSLTSSPQVETVDECGSSEDIDFVTEALPDSQEKVETESLPPHDLESARDAPGMDGIEREVKDSEVPSCGTKEAEMGARITDEFKEKESSGDEVHSSDENKEILSALNLSQVYGIDPPDMEWLQHQLEVDSEIPGQFCCICQNILANKYEVHSCDGSKTTHYMHTDCFLIYIKASCMPGGALDGERFLGGNEQSKMISRQGNLPCPCFMTESHCDCPSISDTKIHRALACSEEVALYYRLAVRRVSYQIGERNVYARDRSNLDRETSDHVLAPALSLLNITCHIRAAIELALDQGLWVKCPNCHCAEIKNDSCMHIRCSTPQCGTLYCYCCGRELGSNVPIDRRCRGCDAICPYIERQPGWEGFAIGNETTGHGALHEFHRQRMAYFVSRIKKTTADVGWEAFERENPNFLMDVPTEGRFILWKELDTATAPVFGACTEEHLLWKLPSLGEMACEADPGRDGLASHSDVVPAANDEEQETGELPRVPSFWNDLTSTATSILCLHGVTVITLGSIFATLGVAGIVFGVLFLALGTAITFILVQRLLATTVRSE